MGARAKDASKGLKERGGGTMYSWFILRNVKLTFTVAGILLILYVFFYSLLQLQDYALLFGSLGLLLILGVIMWLARNIDWYALNPS